MSNITVTNDYKETFTFRKEDIQVVKITQHNADSDTDERYLSVHVRGINNPIIIDFEDDTKMYAQYTILRDAFNNGDSSLIGDVGTFVPIAEIMCNHCGKNPKGCVHSGYGG